MTVRYDDDSRTLTCSARDLIGDAAGGHLTLEVVQSRSARAAAGRQVHSTWQAEQATADEGFRSEVGFRREVVIGAWTCRVQGRVDGLREEGPLTVVEEVKSSVLDASRLFATTAADWPAFVAQLEVYLWLVAAEHAAPVGRLVLVSLADGATQVLSVAWRAGPVEQRILARLGDLVTARESRLQWLAARQARRVPWPYPARRPGQREIAEATEWGLDAGLAVLVEAPTGLGKTAAALHGALQHALVHRKQVFWATPRTTQQAGIERAIRALTAAGLPVRSVRLRARHKACLNDEIRCRPDACRFAEGYYHKLRARGLLSELLLEGAPLAAERLAAEGEAHQVCPVELALDLSTDVDVVIGDYNYVFDPAVALRRHFGDDGGRDWVVVADEVHQLPDRARAAFSPVVEARLAREAVARLWSAGPQFRPVVDLAQRIADAILADLEGVAGEAPIAPDPGRWRALADDVDGVGLDYALRKAERSLPWATDDDPWLALARQVLGLAAGLPEVCDELVPVGDARPGREQVGLRCLDPSPWIGPRLARLGGFVGLSATLRPHDFYVDLLGLDREKLDVVEVGSPFPPERREVLIAPRVSTKWVDRDKHAPATAKLLQRCIEAVPGNVACYFPSFAMLDDLVGRWSLPDRRLLVQAPGMDDAARQAMLDALSAPDAPPAVLAAVLGGVYAEGIDLPAGALSAVLVAGPALPPIGLERDLLKALYERKYGAGFLYASLVPGLSRVVQAAGRLIRRPEDRGVIVLLGRRFRWREVLALLPPELAPRISGDPAVDVAAFYASSSPDVSGHRK